MDWDLWKQKSTRAYWTALSRLSVVKNNVLVFNYFIFFLFWLVFQEWQLSGLFLGLKKLEFLLASTLRRYLQTLILLYFLCLNHVFKLFFKTCGYYKREKCLWKMFLHFFMGLGGFIFGCIFYICLYNWALPTCVWAHQQLSCNNCSRACIIYILLSIAKSPEWYYNFVIK